MVEGQTDSARWSERAVAMWLLAAVVVGLVLRAHGLGSKALWIDEAYSANYAELPFQDLVTQLGREATPPLYYVLLAGWTRIFGSSETCIRALSALFSIAGVGSIAVFAARFVSWRSAAIATSLAAIAPLHVYYAQEARMYSLLSFLAAALVALAARALERPSFSISIAAGLVSLTALWTHNVALWLVAGIDVAFLAIASGAVRTRWFVAQALVAVAYLPWLFVLLGQVRRQGEVLAWFVPIWRAETWIAHGCDSLASFTLGPFASYLAIASAVPGCLLVSAAGAGIAGYGALRMRERREVLLVSVALGVAMALALAYSVLIQPILIPGRTDQALMPLFLILLAIGIEEIRPRIIGHAWLAVFGVGALALLIPYYGNGAKSASRSWLHALAVEAHAGDVVVTTGLTRPEVQYYLRRAAVPARLESFPRSLAGHPGYVNYDALRAEPEQLLADARTLSRTGAEAVAEGHRAFVVLVPGDIHQVLFAELTRTLGSPETIPGAFIQAGTGTPVRLLKFGR